MTTTAPSTGGQARGTLRPGSAGHEQRVGPLGEEGSGSDLPDGEDRPPQGGGAGNQGPVAGGPAAADLWENAVPSGEEIGKRLKDFIEHRGQGLRNMYGETEDEQNGKLEGPIRRGEEMARRLITEMGCTGEVAEDLTVLTLYDVAILIDDSDSMTWEENGERKKTLVGFIDYIREICSMANESGIPAMRFMNREGDIENWQEYLDHHSYGGLTKIGTELKKILDKFAVGGSDQSKPLLVLIVTDGAAEGERKGHLKNVIRNYLNRCEANKRPGVVAFQFSRIGNDPDGAQLLVELDEDPHIGDYVDVFHVEFDLESQLKDKWFILPKILIGAILHDWDKQDDHSGGNKEEDGASGDEWEDD